MALTERLAAATAEARRVLTETITEVVGSDLAALRSETQAAFREVKAADARCAECMAVIRKRIPMGRKVDLPTTSRVVSDQNWLRQQALDADRGALSRPDAVAAFRAADDAVDDAAAAHQVYDEVVGRWNDAVSRLTGAVMASAAPWLPTPPRSGLAVLVADSGRPRGCAVDGQAFTGAVAIPEPSTALDRKVIREHADFFRETWTEPPPPPEPAALPEPTPWDAQPAAATVDPAVLRARAMGVSSVG